MPNVVRFEKRWGETFTDDEATEFIRREKPKVVAYVHAETSTGALQSGHAICAAAHDAGALVIADCVTSLGGVPVEFDQTGIDVAYSCTQKGLSCPPGLSPMAMSPRAMDCLRARTTPSRSWYLDLKLIHDYSTVSHRYHHTAPISMFYALREALMVIAEEGIENRWERHRRCNRAFVKGIEAMGLRMHVPEANRIATLNTVCVAQGVDEAKVRKRLLDEPGIEIAGGFGPLCGQGLSHRRDGSFGDGRQCAIFSEGIQKGLELRGLFNLDREGLSARNEGLKPSLPFRLADNR